MILPHQSEPAVSSHEVESTRSAAKQVPADRPKALTARSAAAAAFCIAVVAVYGRSLYELAVYVMGTSLHSHVVLVPFISAYLLAIDRARLPRAGKASVPFAVMLVAVGIGTYGFGIMGGVPLSQNDRLALVAFSFLCLVWAGGFAFQGREWMRAAAFPLGFLIFMVPLPDPVVHWLETASKFASAEAAAFLIGISGTPMLREGLIFRLPGIALEVAQECSGIRSSWVLFITSLLASHLFLRSNWRRAGLVFFVIPLGVIRNGFRIAVLAWLCVYYSPDMIDSIIHHRGGPIFFALSLGPLFALLWWLRRGEARASDAAQPAKAR